MKSVRQSAARSIATVAATAALTFGLFGALSIVNAAPATAAIGDKCDLSTYPTGEIPDKYKAECNATGVTDAGNPATDGTAQEQVTPPGGMDGGAAVPNNTFVPNQNIINGKVQFDTKNVLVLSNWLNWLALLACIIGICISMALWAMGSKGQNPGQELTGKKGLILCCTAAFFVGALPNMLNWLEGAAKAADTTGVAGGAGGGITAGGVATVGNGSAVKGGTPTGLPLTNAGNGDVGDDGSGGDSGETGAQADETVGGSTLGSSADGTQRCYDYNGTPLNLPDCAGR